MNCIVRIFHELIYSTQNLIYESRVVSHSQGISVYHIAINT